MRSFFACLQLACVLATASITVADVGFKRDEKAKRVAISIDGKPFATLRYGKDKPKPFLIDVRSRSGVILTRPIDAPKKHEHPRKPGEWKEHPHHRGIWISVDEVNTVDFWAEAGRIENRKVEFKQGNPGKLVVVNEWMGKDGQPILTERTRITIYPDRMLTYEISLQAGKKGAHFGDTKEGFFGIRFRDELRERDTGKVLSSNGDKSAKDAWGKPADWIDYTGKAEGKTVGATIFDHPMNLRKSRYHVRNYGLFSVSIFGERAYTRGKEKAKPVEIKAGKSLKLRYGIYIHNDSADAAKVGEAYRRFLKRTSAMVRAQGIADKMFAKMNSLVDTLEGVKDANTGKAAEKKIDQLGEEFVLLKKEADAIKVTMKETQKLTSYVAEGLKSVQPRLQAAIAKAVAKHPPLLQKMTDFGKKLRNLK